MRIAISGGGERTNSINVIIADEANKEKKGEGGKRKRIGAHIYGEVRKKQSSKFLQGVRARVRGGKRQQNARKPLSQIASELNFCCLRTMIAFTIIEEKIGCERSSSSER